MSELASGSVLEDRYRIDELVSVGGMGAVYAGTHLLLHKRVAIKVLRSDLPGGNTAFDRFHREAIAASRIGHENIVQVTDMGIAPGGTAYLVMELLEGESLGSLIRREAPLEIGRACRIGQQILHGVGAAHGAGIVHRDLKPDNVFVVPRADREVVKLLDFGVSLLKRQDLPHTRLTSTGTVVGTPRYMSPEQARGVQDLTEAVDIYAAGVVLYEMLTGELPYAGDNYNVVIHEIMSGELVPIEERRGGIPAGLAGVIRRALALAPENRFADADEMARALEPWRHEASATLPAAKAAPPPRAVPAEALAATEAAAPSMARNAPTVAHRGRRPAARRGRGLALVLGLLLCAGAAAGAYAFWFRGRGDERPGGIFGETQSPPPPSPPSTGPAVVPVPAQVTIDLAITPSSATVFVGGQPVADHRLVLPYGTTPVAVRIEAPDHVTRALDLIPDHDFELPVELIPKASGHGSARPKLPDPEPDPNEPPPGEERPVVPVTIDPPGTDPRSADPSGADPGADDASPG